MLYKKYKLCQVKFSICQIANNARKQFHTFILSQTMNLWYILMLLNLVGLLDLFFEFDTLNV